MSKDIYSRQPIKIEAATRGTKAKLWNISSGGTAGASLGVYRSLQPPALIQPLQSCAQALAATKKRQSEKKSIDYFFYPTKKKRILQIILKIYGI